MKKKLLVILLVIAFIMSFIVATAFAATVGIPEKPV